jgi:hypothetical protein
MTTVSIGYASGSTVVAEFAQSLAILASYDSSKYTLNQILKQSGSLIDDNRNQLVQRFLLSTPSEWLMMLDTDLSFDYDIIDKLLEMAAVTDAKICAGWYNMRIWHQNEIKPLPTVYHSIDDEKSKIHIWSENDPVYIQADAVAAGMLLIHRSVLEAMRPVVDPYYFKFDHKSRATITEDIHFCKNTKLLGYPIYVHKEVRALHYKLQPL